MIAIVYVGRVLEVVFFRPAADAVDKPADPPLSMLAPVVLLAVATIYFGFDTTFTADVADKAARALLGGLR
jgi:multicomponent Na+:H+ antiporter subunit D